jgi:hypothetical protein
MAPSSTRAAPTVSCTVSVTGRKQNHHRATPPHNSKHRCCCTTLNQRSYQASAKVESSTETTQPTLSKPPVFLLLNDYLVMDGETEDGMEETAVKGFILLVEYTFEARFMLPVSETTTASLPYRLGWIERRLK